LSFLQDMQFRESKIIILCNVQQSSKYSYTIQILHQLHLDELCLFR
jgi:hypothetical protein